MSSGTWRKSSYSGGGINNCVELRLSERVSIRDSKRPDAGMLTLAPAVWTRLLAHIKHES